MTITQLEYIIAVDTYRSFVLAAEKCFVTQPTLSMQVQKLEDYLGVKVFDRTKHPISPTEVGEKILIEARKTLLQFGRIQEVISDQQQVLTGELRIGVIPTVAPYLLPQVISEMLTKYPGITLIISEYTTDDIILHLRKGLIDCGILATPLSDPQLHEIPLYYEHFVAYVSSNSVLFKKNTIDGESLQEENVWLMNEGHCMRSQVLSICRSTQNLRMHGLEYNTGSVETLIKMVDLNKGATLLPGLAVSSLTNKQLDKVRYFRSPEPVREISIVTNNNFIKQRMLTALQEEILAVVPKTMKLKKKKEVMQPDIRHNTSF